MYVMSKVRTKRLWCSDCHRKISIGEVVVFKLFDEDDEDAGTMDTVYCPACSEYYEELAINDIIHLYEI